LCFGGDSFGLDTGYSEILQYFPQSLQIH
jgi:hypothetical protein